MTLYETIKTIEDVAKQQPNVNNIIKSGDIFDLNTEEYQQQYSAFCVTQRTHVPQENFITFNFTLYYVDRLTEDKSNKLFVQSTACEILTNIVKYLHQTMYFLEIENSEITTFTQRFTAECAGAFINVSITVPYTNICASTPGGGGTKIPGEFDEHEFSTDFFLYTIIY